MKIEHAKRNVSVVVPVYNSSTILPRLVKELKAVLGNCADRYELILVNDCSRKQKMNKLLIDYTFFLITVSLAWPDNSLPTHQYTMKCRARGQAYGAM